MTSKFLLPSITHHNWRHPISVALTAILLSGCVVGPDYQTPSMLTPSAWTRGKDVSLKKPPELARWWTRLNDPLLDQLVEEAVAGNLDVASSRAKIREARAGIAKLFEACVSGNEAR